MIAATAEMTLGAVSGYGAAIMVFADFNLGTMKLTTIAKSALCVSGLVIGGCGLSEAPPFSPQAISKIQKEQAKLTPVEELSSLPRSMQYNIPQSTTVPATLPATKLPPTGPAIRMTLQEIIHRTVANSLDVRVAGYQAAVDEARILEAEARFDPTIFSSFQPQQQFPQSNLGGNLNPPKVQTQQLQAGIRQDLPDGGKLEARAGTIRTESNPFPRDALGRLQAGTANPSYINDVTIQITQPLLRDFGGEVNRARITIARNDQKISKLDWRDQLEKTLQGVEETYWNLVRAQRDVEIIEQLERQTLDELETLEKRLGLDATPVTVSQAYADFTRRRADLIRAREQIGRQSDQLKRLMNDPDLPVSGPATILPADRPLEEAIRFSLEDQIETALQSRFELMQQKIRIESADIVVGAAKNNLLPQLNIQASGSLQGLNGNFDSAENDIGQFFVYQVNVAFEVPIGNRAARSIYQRTLLQRQQAIEQYRLETDKVVLDVKIAFRDVHTSWNEMLARREARFAAEDVLAGIDQRWRAGEPLTPNFVQLRLDRQAGLADALQAEAKAITDYNIAISSLEKAKGTILRYNNVVMKEEPGPAFANPKDMKRVKAYK